MAFLLSRRGALMASTSLTPDPGPGGPLDRVQLDPDRVPPDYELLENNTRVTRTGTSTDYRRFVRTIKRIETAFGSPDRGFYWEVEITETRGSEADMDGYVGIVEEAWAEASWESNANPIGQGCLGYRGNGSIGGNGSTQLVSGLAPYGRLGDILMFAFDPNTREFWVGLNGVWEADPETDPGLETVDSSGPWMASIQGRHRDDGFRLRSRPQDFSYISPFGFVPLAGDMQTLSILTMFQQSTFAIIGRSPTGSTYTHQTQHVIIGRNPVASSFPGQTLFCIVEP